MKTSAYYTLVFLCTVFISSSISAKDFKVGISTLDYPPFYFEKDKMFYGAAMETAQIVAKNLNHKLVISRYPWRRVQSFLKSGTVEMSILYFKTPERAKDVFYTKTPIIHETSDLFVASTSMIVFDGSLEKLKYHTFGNVRGYSHGKKYDNSIVLKKFASNDEKLLIKKVAHGRVDIGVGNKPAIIRYAKSLNLTDKIKFLEPSLDTSANYIAFSKKLKGAKTYATEFSKELDKFKRTPEYRAILKKYNFDK